MLRTWARRDLRSRYRQSSLRTLWAIWQPLSIILVNGLFFVFVLDVQSDDVPYLSSVIAGVAAYRYLSVALGAATVVTDNGHVVTKAAFPREIIPLSLLLVGLVDLGVLLALLLVVAPVQGVGPSVHLVALPLVLVPLLLVSTAVLLTLSAVAVFVRDVTYVLSTLTQVVFLGTPVMYPATQTPEPVRWVNSVNPLAVVVEAIRDVALRHVWPSWPLLAAHTVAGLCALALAARFFRRLDPRMADVV